MNRPLLVMMIGLTLFGAGCKSSISSSVTPSPAVPVQTAPPTPPTNVPPPTPVKPLEKLPSGNDVSKMSDDDRSKALDVYLTTNVIASAPAVKITLPSGKVVASGSFSNAHHQVSGTAKIVSVDGTNKLILSDDFKTEAGPDLHLVVSGNADPKSSEDLQQTAFVDLGPLQGVSGAQVYSLNGASVKNINSVSVYSKPFQVIYGSASLK